MKRIAIDISQVIYETGVSVYTRNLVENLLRIDKKNEYVLFGGSLRRKEGLQKYLDSLQGRSFKARVFPISPTLSDFIWNRLHILSIEKLLGKIDVFHASDWTQPPSKAFRVTTVHDLVPILYPEWSDPKIVAVHKRRFQFVKREVNKIIVPSHATKKDLMKLSFTADKIAVIPEAVDPVIKKVPDKKIAKFREKYDLQSSFLLSVGIASRKNTQRIINAFNKLNLPGMELVLIGHPYAPISIGRSVRVMGHVAREDLASFYTAAETLVYPSLYEGFGLPILEAFICETPVVTSHSGSMREIAEGSAVLVDPLSTASVAEGIKVALKRRDIYIQKGLKRAKEFSWERCAKMTLEVYNTNDL